MMFRLAILGAVLTAASLSAGARQASTPTQPTPPLFSASAAELVVLPVAVTHGDGQFVDGLTKDQFTVFDNGQPQEISLFTSEDMPVTVGLVLDDSSSMAPKMGQVIAAAGAFARSSNPQDQLFAIAFNDRVIDLTPGRELSAGDPAALGRTLERLVAQGRTALYDGIQAGLQREASSTAPRRVLIVVSDGGDNASRTDRGDVLALALQQNVTIYTIGIFDMDDRDADPGVLKKLARETGGERFLPRSPGPLLAAVEHIAREIREVYTIGYAPPAADGNYHRLRVTVRAPDAKHLDVRTRPGYFAARRPSTQAPER